MTTSYRQILRSTSLVGGSQAINLIIGILRGKVLAVLIGPAGMGLAGMLQSAVGLVEVFAGLGLRQAGVRQIAVASGAGRPDDIARAATTVRRMAVVSALLGLGLVLVFRRQLAVATFGDATQSLNLAVMSLALFFGSLNSGLSAVMQGTRRVGLLALASICATAAGALLGLIPVLAYGTGGIAVMHVTGAAAGCAVMYVFARRAPVARIGMGWRDTWRESGPLLRLGSALMGAALVGAGSVYATQVLISRNFATAGVGLYMAAWTLSGFYVQMILSAMATDFYPRISALVNTPGEMNRVVAEQIQIGLLLAAPGLLFTHAVAPWLLRLLTSAEFLPATAIARWLVIGAALRALSWPVGYMMLAHGRSRLYLAVEVLCAGTSLALLAFGLHVWGLDGSGIAQSLSGLFSAILVLGLGRRLFGFRPGGESYRIAAAVLVCIGLAQAATLALPVRGAVVVGISLTIMAAAGSLIRIQQLTGMGLLDLGRLLAGKGKTA